MMTQHVDNNDRIAGLNFEQLFWLVLAASAPAFGAFLLSQVSPTNTGAVMIVFAQSLGGTTFGLYRFFRVTHLAEFVTAIKNYPLHWLCGALAMGSTLIFTLSVPGMINHVLAMFST